jgi:hypothetical protein
MLALSCVSDRRIQMLVPQSVVHSLPRSNLANHVETTGAIRYMTLPCFCVQNGVGLTDSVFFEHNVNECLPIEEKQNHAVIIG